LLSTLSNSLNYRTIVFIAGARHSKSIEFDTKLSLGALIFLTLYVLLKTHITFPTVIFA